MSEFRHIWEDGKNEIEFHACRCAEFEKRIAELEAENKTLRKQRNKARGKSYGLSMKRYTSEDISNLEAENQLLKHVAVTAKNLLIARQMAGNEIVGYHSETGHALNREGIAAYNLEKSLERLRK